MNFRAFWIRLTQWEYWPFEIVYLPIFIYWIWLSLRARSLLYFTASNTLMKNGGMLGESKMEIFDQLPVRHLPITVKITPADTWDDAHKKVKSHSIGIPCIAKPDIGERGVAVKKIQNLADLEEYHRSAEFPYLVQEFIDLPLEVGIFYYRLPGQKRGVVSSVVYKEMLCLTGNGLKTLKELVYNYDRAFLQRKVLEKRFAEQWNEIIPKGRTIEMEGIGNHSRGTKFLNGNKYISVALSQYFDHLADELVGFYFGRFDIRTASWEALEQGKFMIMELNGAGAEPAHIYDPEVGIAEAYSSLMHHWKMLYTISTLNHARGIPYLTVGEGIKEYKLVLKNKALIQQI